MISISECGQKYKLQLYKTDNYLITVNMKRIVPILVCLVFGLATFYSCKKDPVAPTVTTSDVTNITITSATSGGEVTKDGRAAVSARGICWGTSEDPSLSDSHTSDANGVGSFISNLTDLTPKTVYHIRAYATNKAGTAYGTDISFSTTAQLVPSLATSVMTLIAQTTAVSGGNITADGNAAITAKGVCWATTAIPTINNSFTTDGTGIGSFISTLTGLLPGTVYYIRAYATNSVGTAYGDELTFTTTALGLPVLTTASITSITQTTAVSGGNITSDGGAPVTVRGICWATTTGPTTTNSKTTNSTGTGIYTSNITGLTPGTIYYVRAYATNSIGTAYGNEISFTAISVSLPTLTTATMSSVTATTAVSGGNVLTDGGGTIAGRGVCYSLTAGPTITSSTTSDGSGTGTFVSNLTGLTPGATYHLRAYAVNSAGPAYGTEITFTTLAVLPTVTTTAATAITSTTATAGGNVTANGGGSITAAGICWATTPNPQITNSITTDATTTGVFVSHLTGLTAGNVYHIRAYATNSAGTSYGSDLTFTTPTLPVLATAAVTSITNNGAVSGGSISSDGNGPITAKGVCWSTTPNNTSLTNSTSNGTGTGSFVSTLTSLSPATTYYVRAYATNGAGTSFGSEISFNTKVADADGNLYTYVAINGQVWLTEDLKTTKYSDGSVIPPVTVNLTWSTLTTPGYCWYNNDIANKPTYGAIYNWYAVDVASNGNKNVCPALWRVPTETELEDLITFVGGSIVAGGKLKEAGTTHWTLDNGTNTVGFTALPGGERVAADGGFAELGTDSYHWSSTIDENDNTLGWGQGINTATTTTAKSGFTKRAGASVRCIKN
jgi:uncharacterized protein (TIGR02145 family)